MAVETYEVVASGNLAGQFVANVFHFSGPTTDDELYFSRATNLLAKLNEEDKWVSKWIQCLPEDYKLTSLRARRCLPGGGPTAILLGDQLVAQVGTRSGEIQAAQVNPLIIWIPRDNSNKTGRCFLPGVSEDDLDQMTYVAGLVANMNTFIFEHTDTISPVGFTSDVQGSILRRGAVPVYDFIDNGRVSPIIGTQRRRLRPM